MINQCPDLSCIDPIPQSWPQQPSWDVGVCYILRSDTHFLEPVRHLSDRWRVAPLPVIFCATLPYPVPSMRPPTTLSPFWSECIEARARDGDSPPC